MTLKGINVVCACDDAEYSLFTGQGGKQYPLKQYRVEVNGNIEFTLKPESKTFGFRNFNYSMIL
jgi:hypothetical protein